MKMPWDTTLSKQLEISQPIYLFLLEIWLLFNQIKLQDRLGQGDSDKYKITNMCNPHYTICAGRKIADRVHLNCKIHILSPQHQNLNLQPVIWSWRELI